MIGERDYILDEIFKKLSYTIDNIYRAKNLSSIDINNYFSKNKNFNKLLSELEYLKVIYDKTDKKITFSEQVKKILFRILSDRIYYEKDNDVLIKNENIKKYNKFINENNNNKYALSKIISNEVRIDIDEIKESFEKLFGIYCWLRYYNKRSINLGYFQNSNMNDYNINKLKLYLTEELKFFKNIDINKNDYTISINFHDLGNDIIYKFYMD